MPSSRGSDAEDGARTLADALSVRLKLIARPGYAVGALALVAVLVATAFVVGLNLRLPDSRKPSAEQKPQVAVQVEQRVVQEGTQLVGKVVAPEIMPIAPLAEAAAQAGERLVITRKGEKRGAHLAPGRLLAEVSGRPVMAVAPGMPLYRDFVPGNEGADVRALQRLLAGLGYGVVVDGRLSAVTMSAASSWYQRLGYTLPKAGKKHVLPWRELLPLPSGRLTVVKPAKVGSAVDAEHPLLTVRRGSPVVMVDVDAVQLADYRDARRAYLSVDGESVPARIASIGALSTDEQSGASSYPVTIRLPRQVESRLGGAGTVPVTVAPPENAARAVPLIAVGEDGSGQFVTLVESKSAFGRRVPIEVTAVAGGWAAIATDAQTDELLPVGAKLRVG